MSNEVKSSIMGVMPTPIGKYLYPLEINPVIFKIINSVSLRNNLGNSSSQNSNILGIPEFNELNSFIEFCMQDFLEKVYRPSNNVKVYITDSWINFTCKGEFHHLHHHPNSFLSAVFYLDTIPTDEIIFHHYRKDFLKIQTSEYNGFNSDCWMVNAEKNSLIVFPSYLQHSVNPISEDRKRISLSMNSFVSGLINNENKSSNLTL